MNPDSTISPLLQYGAIGLILMVLLSLFVWVFKAIFSQLLAQLDFKPFLDANTKALTDNTKALEELRNQIDRNHEELMRMGMGRAT